jgi:hypothetical protein
VSAPLQSRFFIVELEPYTYEQFCEITEQLLSRRRMDGSVAKVIANVVWSKSQDIRDCVKIGTIVKTITDVEFVLDEFFGPKTRHGQIQS